MISRRRFYMKPIRRWSNRIISSRIITERPGREPCQLELYGEARIALWGEIMNCYPCRSVQFEVKGYQKHEVILDFDGPVKEKGIVVRSELCVILRMPDHLCTDTLLSIHIPGLVKEVYNTRLRMDIEFSGVQWRTRGSQAACGFLPTMA